MTGSYQLSSTTAVILAGGLGTRLRSVVADRPKVLATVGGRPFLSHLLDQIGSAGIRSAVLCTGYLGEQIQELYGNSYNDIELVYSQEAEPLGTGGALRLAHSRIQSSSILVLNGDSFCDADLLDLWDWHHVHPAHVSVVTAQVPDARSFGRIDIDANDRITRFREKSSEPVPGKINAGIYLMHAAILGRIPCDRPVSLEQELFPKWVSAGGVYSYPTGAPFIDIGTPDRFALAEEFVRSLPPRHRGGAIEEIASALASVQGEPR